MKQICGWMLTMISVVLIGTPASMAWAQGAPSAAPSGEKVLIRHKPRLPATKIFTPQFSANAGGGAVTPARQWALFETGYTTTPEWLDEIVVTYYLLAEQRGTEAKKEYTLYKTTVHYENIARGDHRASVALPPALLARYGERFVAFAIEIASPDNTVLAAENVASGISLPAEWWKNTKITDDKSVIKREGLVDRSKTPFALINSDDYEVVK